MGFDYTVVLVRRGTSQIFSLGRQLLANSAKKIVRYARKKVPDTFSAGFFVCLTPPRGLGTAVFDLGSSGSPPHGGDPPWSLFMRYAIQNRR